ncbi:MAG: UDP-4-amino-4,6-dideoxy-N-acetyl-beta-L-altrosamine transaminase [Burkholderiaceae bacterium]|nr:UDP-4-amino-4,6-dideoxy-N-acetyl-beta-L-altrosamine transaminase [Burkholderiaceae bacterium]
MIPYGRQNVSAEDVQAVVDVLRSDFLTQGPVVPAFEQAIVRLTGARHAVAVNSATSALHVACLALGLGPGDRLWTVPNTFLASANCARYCGADVDFVDIDPGTWNMSAPALEQRLKLAEAAGRLPRVVVPVAFGGQSCDMRAIRSLADRYRFAVIEDASHAVGARYAGRPVGCGEYADVTIFSFHPVKIVTSAEGGMALTQDDRLASRMQLFRSHGMTRDPALMEGASEGGWYYEQIELGYNYRMTELQAALGLSQLERLASFVERRHQIAARYAALLDGLPLETQQPLEAAHSALHLYPVRLRDSQRRRSVFDAMRNAGVGVNVHYIPVHLQPYYRRLGFACGDFPVAESYYAGAITLPMYPDLSEAQQDHVVASLREALR